MGRGRIARGAPLLLALAACSGPPLDVAEGPMGAIVDSSAGLGGRNREMCVRFQDGGCMPILTVHALRDAADIHARWRNEREVEIFVIGGSIRRCRPEIAGGIKVRLHRWEGPIPGAPSVEDHGPSSSFRKLPDVCGQFA